MPDRTPDGASVAEALRALWEEHRERIFGRIDTIEEAIAALMEGALDDGLREEAVRDAHKLAGSLGTFGFAEGTRISRDIERMLGGEAPPEPRAAVGLSELVVALRHAIEDDPDFGEAEAEQGVAEREAEVPTVLVVTADLELASRLEVDLAGLRLAPTVAHDLESASLDPPPRAVILDLVGSEPDDFSARLETLPAETLPAVLVGSDDLDLRLAAARAGGRLVFRPSMGSGGMARALAEALSEHRMEEATVLSVDDDPAVGAAVRTHLEARGLTVESIQDPSGFLDALDQLSPDLVILDIDMPEISGLDLCRLVRSDPARLTLPVLFLTASDEHDVIAEAFEAGADDFVRKPIVGPVLVRRVFNRLERVRILRRMAEQDPLTGLPNRTTASPAIGSLIELAGGNDAPLAFALVDLDGVAKVNARHGFSAGDQPIRRLARLLGTEFEREAVVTRWSGVTFGVGCYGVDAGGLSHRLAELSEEFSSPAFEAGDGDSFRMTFSAGVAEFPADGRGLRELIRAADRALAEGRTHGPGTVWTTTSSEGGQGTTRRVEVLIVDDDEPIAELLTQALQTRGFSTHWIGDGREALDALVGRPPAVSARVLVLDVGLPGMDGLSVLRRLAREGLTERMRVMVLTARTAESEVLRALELGAFDHVAKPFSLPILLHKIRTALEL